MDGSGVALDAEEADLVGMSRLIIAFDTSYKSL